MSSTSSSSPGILLYNSIDDSINKIYNSNYRWENFQIIENCCIISPWSGSDGLLLYDYETDQITQIYNEGNSFKYFQQVTDVK